MDCTGTAGGEVRDLKADGNAPTVSPHPTAPIGCTHGDYNRGLELNEIFLPSEIGGKIKYTWEQIFWLRK